MLAILKFITFNTILPLVDMSTDVRAVILYLTAVGVAYHPNWAALTLVWIVVPFLLHLVKFLYQKLARTGEASWRDLFLHIPFVLPIRNLYYAYLLHKLDFGRPNFESKNWAAVEAIQKQVAKDGLSESYFESGPQAHSSYLSYFLVLNLNDLKML